MTESVNIGVERQARAYQLLHLALRQHLAEGLIALAHCRLGTEVELDASAALLDELVQRQRAFMRFENDCLHPALERASPGCSAGPAHEHRELLTELDALAGDLSALRSAASADRPRLLQELELRFTRFAGEALVHQSRERRLCARAFGRAPLPAYALLPTLLGLRPELLLDSLQASLQSCSASIKGDSRG